jgi:hypothetical protein
LVRCQGELLLDTAVWSAAVIAGWSAAVLVILVGWLVFWWFTVGWLVFWWFTAGWWPVSTGYSSGDPQLDYRRLVF